MLNDTKYQEDVRRLTRLTPDNWALCEFFEGHRRASEMEYMVATTLHACVKNLDKHGEVFSFVNTSVHGFSGGGLVDNRTAWGQLVNEYLELIYVDPGTYGSVPEGTVTDEKGQILICQPTIKLMNRLEEHHRG